MKFQQTILLLQLHRTFLNKCLPETVKSLTFVFLWKRDCCQKTYSKILSTISYEVISTENPNNTAEKLEVKKNGNLQLKNLHTF